MHLDARGLPMSTDSAKAAAAFDHLVVGYLTQRVDTAAATLFRLQRLGVDVGDRWEELADKAEARIGDCLSAFTLPHWLMALTATGRIAAAERMVEAMRVFANGDGTVPRIVRNFVLPIAEATHIDVAQCARRAMA